VTSGRDEAFGRLAIARGWLQPEQVRNARGWLQARGDRRSLADLCVARGVLTAAQAAG